MFLIEILFSLIGILFLILHGISVHRLGNYIKGNHPMTWKELEPKSFLFWSQDEIESRNYFKEMGFYLSGRNLSDEHVRSSKFKIKCYLFIGILACLISFLVLLL